MEDVDHMLDMVGRGLESDSCIEQCLYYQVFTGESAHVRTFDGDFELKIMRMRGFSSQFLDNQPENRCIALYYICGSWSFTTGLQLLMT